MYMLGISLSYLALLASALPNPVVEPDGDVDVENPSGSDPTSIPDKISFPTNRPDNPYPSGTPELPSECDIENPSDDCFETLARKGGGVYHEPHKCWDREKKAQVEQALWDAHILAEYSKNFPENGLGGRGHATGDYYFGHDFKDYADRISGNFGRVAKFSTGATSSRAYISVSCDDKKKWCPRSIDGKAVGGYAETINGWFGEYYYITLCDAFFLTDSLDDKIVEMRKNLGRGSWKEVRDMRWLKTTGELFLHEMMHLKLAWKGQPKIIDQTLADLGSVPPDGSDRKAYGPARVHSLARRTDGGARRSSTNADSYAMAANAAFWWDTTGAFPGVPNSKTKPTSVQEESAFDGDEIIFLHADLGNTTDPSDVDVSSMFADDLESYRTPSSDSSDDDDDDDDDEPPTPTSTSSASQNTEESKPSITLSLQRGGGLAKPDPTPEPEPELEPKSEPEQICNYSYQALLSSFEVYGKDFDAEKFDDGDGLHHQIKGCDSLTGWHFKWLEDDPQGMQWKATGHFMVGKKACLGRAIVSAGGSGNGGCHGAG